MSYSEMHELTGGADGCDHIEYTMHRVRHKIIDVSEKFCASIFRREI
jgi:hypothetical protein